MLLVLAMGAALWGIGRLMGAPRVARAYMLGLLYVAVLMVHLVLPEGHPLRVATGGSAARGWHGLAQPRPLGPPHWHRDSTSAACCSP